MNVRNYEMIVWWSDENATFVVEMPELPGCLVHGTSRQGAIRFWIQTAQEDGLEIPQPRGRLIYA